MEGMRWLPIAATVLCLEGAVRLAEAQSMRPADLGAGKLLVASRDLPDPNFAKTVVLLVQYDEDGVVGLILNRRSKVPISRVLDEVAGAKERPDPVYAGGPVGRTEVLALVRSRRPLGDAKRVFGDVFDPNFAKTVVLLVQYDEDGVVGLILNRRSKVPISRGD